MRQRERQQKPTPSMSIVALLAVLWKARERVVGIEVGRALSQWRSQCKQRGSTHELPATKDVSTPPRNTVVALS